MDSEEMQSQLDGIILEEQSELTLADISRSCAVHAEYIIELVDEGVLAPVGSGPVLWRFTGGHTHRVIVAMHLQRDLGINLSGVALVLQLLDEVKELRSRLRLIESE